MCVCGWGADVGTPRLSHTYCTQNTIKSNTNTYNVLARYSLFDRLVLLTKTNSVFSVMFQCA